MMAEQRSPNPGPGCSGDEATLRRQLAEAQERNLNAVDAIQGAEAQVAQVKRDADELFHRLEHRETELRRLKELLGYELDTPLEQIQAALEQRGQGAGWGGPGSVQSDSG